MRVSVSKAGLLASLVLVLAAPVYIGAQEADRSPGAGWSYTFDVGGFAQGNGNAIRHWLSSNAYGATEPRRCSFDLLFRPICDDPVGYPKSSGGSAFGVMGSVRRSFSNCTALELFLSMEQTGEVTGRCDDLATPKDPRCADRFMDVEFGGASFSLLGEISRGWLHVGAGPALMLANWDMTPTHLLGVWLDATIERDPFPFFVQGQYRYYSSTGTEWAKGFSGFHPSSLFFTLGVRTRLNNGGS